MRGLKGKRIVIGGGATGMGASLALRLADEGAHVLVGDINEAALKTLAGRNKAITAQHFDLADAASIDALIVRAVTDFGGLDGIAITGADLSKATLGNDVELMGMDVTIWERTLKVNLIGHALTMRAAIPHLKAAGGGSIVAVSSGSANQGQDTMPAYAASKAGLQALIRHVARIAGKANIRCNGVAPGMVLTEGALVNTTPDILASAEASVALPRLGQPEDLASIMAFLLSDESAWISGQTISVNGGGTFRD